MSSICSAIHDDEDRWYDLKKLAGITNNWDVYSKEASFAREAYTKLGYTKEILLKYVSLQMDLLKLQAEHRKSEDEYKLYLQLKKRFENA